VPFSGYSRSGPNSGFGLSPAGPLNTYLPPNSSGGGFGSQSPSSAFAGQGFLGGSGFGGLSFDTPSSIVGPRDGSGGSPNGPSNAYLPPGGGLGPQGTEFGNQGPSGQEPSSNYGAPQLSSTNAGAGSFKGFPSGSGNFRVSPSGPTNAYLPPRSGDSQRPLSGFGGLKPSGSGSFGSSSGSYGTPSAASSGFGGRDSDAYDVPVSGGRFGGQGPSRVRPSGTYGSPTSEGNGFGGQGPPSVRGFLGGSLQTYGAPSSGLSGFDGQRPSGGSGFGRTSGTYGAPASGDSGFGSQGPSGRNGIEGSPSGTYSAPASGGSGFRGQGPSVGRPSARYEAPPSRGSRFSGQGNFGGRVFGGQPLKTFHASASESSAFGGQGPSGGRPLGAYGAPSSSGGFGGPSTGGFNGPSNAYLPPDETVIGPSKHSGGFGGQNSGRPSSFHSAPGLGGYNNSPSGPSNSYHPHIPGESFGGQGPSRNSGFSEQDRFGSRQLSGSYNSPNAGASGKALSPGQGRLSGTYSVPATRNPSGGLDTYTGSAGGFTASSNAYLPPGSSFNDQGSGSDSFSSLRHRGSGFSKASNDGSGLRGPPSAQSNTYLPPGSGGSSSPSVHGRLSSQYGVPSQGGGFGQRSQTGNNGTHEPQRHGSGRSSGQGGSSGRPTTFGIPSQRGQADNSAFEGYKY